MYSCEIPGCNRSVAIRSKIRSGEHKGLMACPVCSFKTKPNHKKPKPIKKITEKTLNRKKERSLIRDKYFEHHLPLIEFSEESLRRIYNPSRSNCCHILPKSQHTSVQGHILNAVYLTLEEHTRFDYLMSTLQISKLEIEFPRSWPIICKRLKTILPLCEENTNLSFRLKEYLEEKSKT